jgi:hypothetical protein
MQHLEVTVTPTDVRQAWATIREMRNPFSSKQSNTIVVTERLSTYRGNRHDDFIGASGAQIQDRLEHGFTPDGTITADLTGAEDYVVPAPWLDEEEGDLLIDQALSGEDQYRVQWQDQGSPKSLTIRANIGFSADVNAGELGRYMSWILKVADAARRSGAMPTIELMVTTGGSFARSKDRMKVVIPLVQPGEIVDETAWRAYLAPGAFRSLGFVAILLGADKLGRTLTRGLGYPTNREWSVAREGDVLEITCPGSMDHFPESELDRMLETATAV